MHGLAIRRTTLHFKLTDIPELEECGDILSDDCPERTFCDKVVNKSGSDY